MSLSAFTIRGGAAGAGVPCGAGGQACGLALGSCRQGPQRLRGHGRPQAAAAGGAQQPWGRRGGPVPCAASLAV